MFLVLFSVSTHSMYTHENNGPSCLSPQWLCGNSCTWSHEDIKYGYTLLYQWTKDPFYSYKNIFNIYNKYCRPSDDWDPEIHNDTWSLGPSEQLLWFIIFWMQHLESWWLFLKIVSGFNKLFSSLIILLTYSWSLLQHTMILVEVVRGHLDSSIQHLSLSNCIFIILRLPYIEINLHTSTFITESLLYNSINQDQEMYCSRKIKLLLSWMRKNFPSELNYLILLSIQLENKKNGVNTYTLSHFFHYRNMDIV